MKLQYGIRDVLALTGWWAAILSAASLLGFRIFIDILAISLFAGSLLFTFASSLYLIRKSIHAFWDWLDEDPVAFTGQFAERTTTSHGERIERYARR